MSRDRLANLRMNDTHEMTPVGNGRESEMGQREFLAEISSIQDEIARYNANVKDISSMNSRALGAVTSENDSARLERLQIDTKKLSDELRDRIRRLTERDMTKLSKSELQMRKDQIKRINSNFKEALQHYQRIEVDHQARSKQRIERQFRIVKPDASPEEIRAVVDNGQTQIFADALSRVGQSQTVYSEVRQRQQDLQKMEQTLADLAQVFSDMAYIVQQQDEIFDNLERTTSEVQNNTEKGLDATNTAVKHARNYRRGRIICFGISVAVIIIIILVVVLGVCLGANLCGARN